ncbi:MAG: hypothetical protein ATN33_07735 [Epulopiscium sp. Nele67-Bin001]|nr:MAG: hypothetical protein ATN33_07735 [Epulopiscium sp. Nele67-Bin001]
MKKLLAVILGAVSIMGSTVYANPAPAPSTSSSQLANYAQLGIKLNGIPTTPIIQGNEVYVSLNQLMQYYPFQIAYTSQGLEVSMWQTSSQPTLPNDWLVDAQYINQATIKSINDAVSQIVVLPYGLDDNIHNYIALNVSHETITGSNLSVGMTVSVAHSSALTRSTPAQATAYYIIPTSPSNFTMHNVEIIGISKGANDWTITVGNPNNPLSQTVFSVNANDTLISHYMNKSIYTVNDLEIGLIVDVTYAPNNTSGNIALEIEISGPSN